MPMSSEEFLAVLNHEFNAEEGSFLLQLRCQGRWDWVAFARLTSAMEACCEHRREAETVERWVANGFWFCDVFVKEQARHSGMRLPGPPEDYERAFEQLAELAHWFFYDEHPGR
jgi:hypothetical protein